VIDKTLDLEAELAELDDVARMLEEDRRTSDPNRGVVCSRGCSERPCSHVAHLVEAIIREEER
jgi:hypothetical protein